MKRSATLVALLGLWPVLFAKWDEAYAYHVIGGTIAPLTDTQAPSVQIIDPLGNIIQPGTFLGSSSMKVRVMDDGGISGLEVTRGAPIVDAMGDLFDGTADYVYKDHATYGTSHEYTVDLTAIPEGTKLFVQAFDAAGNYASVDLSIAHPQILVENGKLILSASAKDSLRNTGRGVFRHRKTWLSNVVPFVA